MGAGGSTAVIPSLGSPRPSAHKLVAHTCSSAVEVEFASTLHSAVFASLGAEVRSVTVGVGTKAGLGSRTRRISQESNLHF